MVGIRLRNIFPFASKITIVVNAKIYLFRALLEYAFLVIGFGFANIFAPLLHLGLFPAVSFLKNAKNLPKLRLVFTILYIPLAVVAFSFLDQMAVLIYNAGVAYYLPCLLAIFLASLLLRLVRILDLKWYHGGMVVAVFMLFFVSGFITRSHNPSECERQASDPAVRFLFRHQPDRVGLPRMIVMDPEEETIFLSYRFKVGEQPDTEHALLVVDRVSREGKYARIPPCEIIGMTFDRHTDRLLVAAVYPASESQKYMGSLFWVDRQGELTRRIDLPNTPFWTYYFAMMPLEESVNLCSTRQCLTVDRKNGAISQRQIEGFHGLAICNSLQVGETIFLAVCGSSILHAGFPSVFTVDPPDLAVRHGSPSYLCGSQPLAFDSVKNHLYANGLMSGTLRELDSQLKPVRNVRIGGAIRNFAVDSARRRGYALDYVSGKLTAFDLDSGAKIGSRPGLRESRVISVTSRGELLIGSVCGLFELDQVVWAIQ